MPEIIKRKDAIKLGKKRYFTGKPCKHGHVDERSVISQTCLTCVIEAKKRYKEKAKPLDFETAQELFRYDQEAGHIWRKKRDGTYKIVSGVNGQSYIVVHAIGKNYLAHRIAFIIQGIDCEGFQVDHIDGNKTNNRWENLRLVSNKENHRNQALSAANKSGRVGVRKMGNRWRAEIKVDGNQIVLGMFGEKAQAIKARENAELKHGFHPNHGRPPIKTPVNN